MLLFLSAETKLKKYAYFYAHIIQKMSVPSTILSEANRSINIDAIAKDIIKIASYTGTNYSGPLFAVGNNAFKATFYNAHNAILKEYVREVLKRIIEHQSFTDFVNELLPKIFNNAINSSTSVTSSVSKIMDAFNSVITAAICQGGNLDAASISAMVEKNDVIRETLNGAAVTMAKDIHDAFHVFKLSDKDFNMLVGSAFDHIVKPNAQGQWNPNSLAVQSSLYLLGYGKSNEGYSEAKTALINSYEKFFFEALTKAYEKANGRSSIEADIDYESLSFTITSNMSRNNTLTDFIKAAGHFTRLMPEKLTVLKDTLKGSDFHARIHNAMIELIADAFHSMKSDFILDCISDIKLTEEIKRNAAKSFSPGDIGDKFCDLYMKQYVDPKIAAPNVRQTIRSMFRNELAAVEKDMYIRLCDTVHSSFACRPEVIVAITNMFTRTPLSDYIDYTDEFHHVIYNDFINVLGEEIAACAKLGLRHSVEILSRNLDKLEAEKKPAHADLGSHPTQETIKLAFQ